MRETLFDFNLSLNKRNLSFLALNYSFSIPEYVLQTAAVDNIWRLGINWWLPFFDIARDFK